MPVPSSMSDLSVTAASNSPPDTENLVSVDDYLRSISSLLRHTNAKGTDIASAATTSIGAATGEFVHVTGTTTITSFGTNATAGIRRVVLFTGALTLTHNATSLILPTGANITTEADDVAFVVSLGSNNWRVLAYLRKSGLPLSTSFTDSTFEIKDNSDATKKVAFQVSGVTTGTTRTLTVPNSSGTIALTSDIAIQQLYPITASVAANALTVTINATSLDFRSTTLTSGTQVTRTASSPSVTVSNGSTLGTSSGIAARLAVLAIDNAGTVEAAIVNTAGGLLLDESNLINTTAEGGAGAADSASTIYSTTARTGVAYRVLGFIDITQATAGTWASAPTLVQPIGGQAKIKDKIDAVRVYTDNGAGSTNTAIRRFTTTDYALGTAITYADSATNGASFTINERGLYSISFTDNFSVAAHMGISRNSSQLTTAVNSINASDCLAQMFTTSGNGAGCVMATVYLEPGDVIRPHCGVSLTNGTATGETFVITKVLSL